MSATPTSSDSSLHSTAISNRASRAGRELVWLTVAAAFFVVEAVVFFTDLPVTKLFNRREPQKTNSRVRA